MCGAFDVACHVATFFAPIIFWAKIVIYCAVGVLVAALLLWAYRKAGWWGVGIVLTLGLGAGVFKITTDIGRKSFEEPKARPKRPDPAKPLVPDLDELLKDIFDGNRRK